MKGISRLLLVVLTMAFVATPVVAQRRAAPSIGPHKAQGDRPELGPQAGYASNSLDFLIGAQFAYPVANRFDLYPSFNYYFPGNRVTVWGFDGNFRYWPKLNIRNPGLYIGGGLNYTRTSVDFGPLGSVSNGKVGLGVLGGWEFKASTIRPFGQIKIVIGDADRVEFGGGVNFRL